MATITDGSLGDTPLETTISLLDRARGGDSAALDQLVERSLPPLRRWARGRLPQWARNLADTQDLVQDAVLRTLPRLQTFKAEHPGALQAFLRQAISNHIIDEIRKVQRRPTTVGRFRKLPTPRRRHSRSSSAGKGLRATKRRCRR